jgi:hypothetical protein
MKAASATKRLPPRMAFSEDTAEHLLADATPNSFVDSPAASDRAHHVALTRFVLDRDEGKCAWCERTARFAEPIDLTGRWFHVDNLVAACRQHACWRLTMQDGALGTDALVVLRTAPSCLPDGEASHE